MDKGLDFDLILIYFNNYFFEQNKILIKLKKMYKIGNISLKRHYINNTF